MTSREMLATVFMFATRARALFSTHLRRQTAAHTGGSGGGGQFEKGKNNALLATAAVATVLGGMYYMGYWDKDKAKGCGGQIKRVMRWIRSRRSELGWAEHLLPTGDRGITACMKKSPRFIPRWTLYDLCLRNTGKEEWRFV
ncbi:hypothetical protein C8R45DRAFT_259087 [Mycena sanguinolenta]|nr:hypothetical protein C8R45DRAFT_259087 [Mycena sanguinolenta]